MQETGPTARFRSVPAGAWATAKVSGCGGVFGSVALTVNDPGAPEKTLVGAMWATVGADAALMVTVVLAVFVPQAFVAVRLRVTGEVAPTDQKVAAASVGLVRVPLLAVHPKVTGVVPVALPARVMLPPLATEYGPPGMAVGGVQAGVGTTLLGHGFSCPTPCRWGGVAALATGTRRC